MAKQRADADKRRTDRRRSPAVIFDLDGTLVDSVYQHVLAWSDALERAGLKLSVWRIHRRIGMSGGLFVNALSRETGRAVTPQEAAQLQRDHVLAFRRQKGNIRPLPGAAALLAHLSDLDVPWAIATSGRLSGGYGFDELERAGAYRVYQDPADLLLHLDEIGVRSR
jgi:phosphoglycolate phosphatase-like HAD superfamily hydrolase